MGFDTTKNSYNQEHFTIIEIDVPVVEGKCTLGSGAGYGTALTCDQATNATKTYRFTQQDAPMIPLSEVWRCVTGISETPTELQSGRGLASRGTASISLIDFVGDPNPLAPAVTEEVKKQGGFIAKLDARNILQGKALRIKNYRIGDDGQLPDFDNDAEVRHYIIDNIQNSGVGKWSIKAKDELSKIDLGEKVFPQPTNGYLRGDIFAGTTTIPVDPIADYAVGDIVRVGNELMKISAVSGIGGASAEITVSPRGDVGISGILTEASGHSGGDEIFPCKTYESARIDTVLYDVLVESGINPDCIPLTDWQAELDIWHSATRITYIFTEAEDTNDVLAKILESYMIDMWFDPVDRLVKISAISEWQQSSNTLVEGKDINYESVKLSLKDDLRATDALVVYNKPYLARDDATENYTKAVFTSDPRLSSDDYYGEVKQKRFDNNPIIDTTAANLLVSRYIGRFGLSPTEYRWVMEERKLNIKTGDVINLQSIAKVGFNGLPSTNTRAQITAIKPNYSKIGRNYSIKALTYSPFETADATRVFTGQFQEFNLWEQSGGPSAAATYTFVFENSRISSTSNLIPALSANGFATGSHIIIIFVGTSAQGKGGDGGQGGSLEYDAEQGQFIGGFGYNGKDGGVTFDGGSRDITIDIYLEGATGNAQYPTARGYLRAAGGGGAGSNGDTINGICGSGGGGGAGDVVGLGGAGGVDTLDGAGEQTPIEGFDGNNGGTGGVGGAGGDSAAGKGGDWGQAGENTTSSLGGAAGKGVVDGAATVTLHYTNPSRYINGNGDHP